MPEMRCLTEQQLWENISSSEPACLAAILDPVLWKGLDAALCAARAELRLLVNRAPSREVAAVLPRCILLRRGERLTGQITEGLSSGRGVLVKFSNGQAPSLDALVMELFPNTHAVLPDEESVWFRFYDADILRDYLAVADETQLTLLYGSCVDSFAMAGSDPDSFNLFPRPLELPSHPPRPGLVRISAEQMEAMSEARFHRFLHELVCDIARDMPSEAQPRAALKEQVAKSVDEAERMGLSTFRELAAYALLAARYGGKLLELSESDSIMRNAELSPQAKLYALQNLIAVPGETRPS